MPFKSKAQARALWAKNPKVAQEFADATPNIKALPERLKKENQKGQEVIELTFSKENKRYTLRYQEIANYWFLSNEEGEGMGLGQEVIFEILNKYFTENF